MNIERILAIRNDRFGEFLLNIPALNALKESFSNSKLTLIVDPYVRELAQCIDSVDEVTPWENKRHSLSEILRFSRQLKNKKFGLCVIFNPSKESHLISFLAGITLRLGYNRKFGFLLTHKIKDEKYQGRKHEVEYNLELVNAIGAKTANKTFSLSIGNDIISKTAKDFCIENYSNPIAIHPWTSDSIKQWPLDKFSQLARKLAKEPDIEILIVGGREEKQKSSELFSGINDKVIDITGRTTLKQLAAILKKCRLLISNDSGPVHLACAVNTPVLAIFRNDLPEKSAARWGPWGDKHIVIEKNNLSDISVDEVFDKVKYALKK